MTILTPDAFATGSAASGSEKNLETRLFPAPDREQENARSKVDRVGGPVGHDKAFLQLWLTSRSADVRGEVASE